ncbi:MAG: DUF4350 domain-containing protein [Terriglobales bacterium]
MSGMIRQNWLAIVLGIGILLVMSAAAYLKSEEAKGDGHPSSYSNLRHGAKAAYLLLQQSGYPMERWERSPKELPADGHGILLIVADPVSYPNTEESGAFSRFLLHGGTIIVAGLLPDAFVPKAAATDEGERIGDAECKPVAPTRLTRGGSISQDGVFMWDSADSSPVVHFADEKGNAVVVSYAVGAGSVIWWASALPLENAGIREKNNLELLLNSTSGYKRVLWDEFYQGQRHQKTGHKPVRAYEWAMAQFALIAIAVVLTYSRRSGPLVPLMQESRLSPLEFVETLGNVFRRSQGTHVAVEIAFQRFRQVAARRLGIRGTSNSVEIVDAMDKHGVRLPESTAALVRGSETVVGDSTLTERAALEYVRALNKATHALDPTNKMTNERN